MPLILILVSFAFASVSEAGKYRLELVARQNEVIDGQSLGFFRGVAIDDLGNIAYTAVAVDQDTAELTGSAILIANQTAVGTGDNIPSGKLGFLGEPSLSSDGTLAYSADVFIQGNALSSTSAVVGDPSLSSSHQLMAGRNTVVEGITLEGVINPTINDAGSLAYTGIYTDTQLNLKANAVVHNNVIIAATGDTIGDFIIDTVDQASLSASGDLAFEANLIHLPTSTPVPSIFANGQVVALALALTDGLELTDVFSPAMNGPGDLAYVGQYFEQALNQENTAIILNGEVIIQSGDLSVDELILDRINAVSLNASGELAFHANFIDRATGNFFEEGIFRAVLVPEPATVAFVLASLLFLPARRLVRTPSY